MESLDELLRNVVCAPGTLWSWTEKDDDGSDDLIVLVLAVSALFREDDGSAGIVARVLITDPRGHVYACRMSELEILARAGSSVHKVTRLA